MPSLPDQEAKRLSALLHDHSLDEHQALILREARPAISLFVDRIVGRDQRIPMTAYPVGTSRFGGVPDLAAGMDWPEENGEPLTFVLQLALASLPAMHGNPLPSTGMLWLFHGSPDSQDGLDAKILWRDCEPSRCRRCELASSSDAIDFREYEPFAIDAVLGTDFPPTGQHDDRPIPGASLPASYFDFVTRARDPDFDRREATGYPYHWHYIGQLFGVTSPALQRDGRAHWQRLLSLSDNPMTDFSTLIDTAALHYMIEARQTPWTTFDPVFVASAV